MSAFEIDALLDEVARGTIAIETAVALMVIHGADRDDATRRAFQALGAHPRLRAAHRDPSERAIA